MTDDLKPETPKQKRRSGPSWGAFWKAVAVAVVGIGAAGALGYYGWNVRDARNTKSDLLEVCQKDLGTTKTEHADFSRRAVACETEYAAKKADFEATNKDLERMRADMNATVTELTQLREQRAAQDKRIAAFQELQAKFKAIIDDGKISVVKREGRMVVELPAEILFASGKAELSREGEMALMEVAVILKQFPERRFLIAGHTDNYEVRNPKYGDNWGLSSARAVNVVKFLIEAKMKPENLAATGYGEHHPITENKTAKGRQANRRIEIVLVPNLDEMPKDLVEDSPPEKHGQAKNDK